MRRAKHQHELDLLTDALERAGVRGRGGAAFPTATKLNAVAAARGKAIVVVNATEGEPLSKKDRYLLSAKSDTVLDGALAAARAVGADEIIVAIEEGMRSQRDRITRAIAERPELNRSGMKTFVQSVPPGYVTGQETALINALCGRPAKPSLTPPYPFESGIDGRPTLVCNAETFSQIGRVAAGTYDGTRLVTLAGAVAQPGLVEIDSQTTLAVLCETAGGLTENAQGVLLGGYGGTWTDPYNSWGLTLDEMQLRERGLTLGAGIVLILGESACPVAETARVVRWMSSQSAGQCGPCVNGLDAIATALEDLTVHGDTYGSYAHVQRWVSLVQKRGACSHPDGVARFVTTAVNTFAEQFARHSSHGACERCAAPPVLPIPSLSRSGAAGQRSRAPRIENQFWPEASLR